MRQVSFSVRGQAPAAWGNSELPWRRAVADAARSVRLEQPDATDTEFSVSVVFNMNASAAQRTDLDNLAKPVLDTLFRSRHPQVKDKTLTGALFEQDDDCVFSLFLKKRKVESDSDVGADIAISWE